MSIMTTENGISIAGGGQGGGQSESTGDKSGVINLADKVGNPIQPSPLVSNRKSTDWESRSDDQRTYRLERY